MDHMLVLWAKHAYHDPAALAAEILADLGTFKMCYCDTML